MPINLLVLTDKSFAASSVEDVRRQQGFVSRERLATKGEFLQSPLYNHLLNLDATQAGLMQLSLEDVFGTSYCLAPEGASEKAPSDPLSESLSAEETELLQALRFYTVGDSSKIDLKRLRTDFDGVLLFMTESLGSSTQLSAQLFHVIEAMTAPSLEQNELFATPPLSLLVFNLRFNPAEIAHYAREKEKAAADKEAASSTMQEHSLAVQEFPFLEEYRTFERFLELIARAHTISTVSPEDLRFVQQHCSQLSTSTAIYSPNPLSLCSSRAQIQSFMRTVRMLQALRAAERSEPSSTIIATLQAALRGGLESNRAQVAAATVFREPARNEMLFMSLESEGSGAAEAQRPLTIALNSIYLALLPAVGCAPLAHELILAVRKAFPAARIVLLFDETIYSWLECMPSDNALLAANGETLGHSGVERGYVALDSGFCRFFNRKQTQHTLLRSWLTQEPLADNSVQAPDTAGKSTDKSSEASSFSPTMGQILGLEPMAQEEHSIWQQSLESGRSFAQYLEHFRRNGGTARVSFGESADPHYEQVECLEEVAGCYLMFSYSEGLPKGIDLVLSDNEGLILNATAAGIAALHLCHSKEKESALQISGPMLPQYVAASWLFEMLLSGDVPPAIFANFVGVAAQKIEAMPRAFAAAGAAESKRFDSSIRGSYSTPSAALALTLSYKELFGGTQLRTMLRELAAQWSAEKVAAAIEAFNHEAHKFKGLLHKAFGPQRKEIPESSIKQTPALQSRVQWSNYTFGQRYEHIWQFLRFFAELSRAHELGAAGPTLSSIVQKLRERQLGGGSGTTVVDDGIKRRRALLSFGCARGDEIWDLAHFFPDMVAVGTDINEGALEQARLRAEQENMLQEQRGDVPPKLFVQPNELDACLAQQGIEAFDVVTAMTVLCRHPESLAANADIKKLYPYSSFEGQMSELYARTAEGGLLCVFNSNYSVDELLQDESRLSDFALLRLFPFAGSTNKLEVKALPQGQEQHVAEILPAGGSAGVGAVSVRLHEDMPAGLYFSYLCSALAAAQEQKLSTIYLPADFAGLYRDMSMPELFGYTSCFNAEGQHITTLRGCVYYKCPRPEAVAAAALQAAQAQPRAASQDKAQTMQQSQGPQGIELNPQRMALSYALCRAMLARYQGVGPWLSPES